MLPTDSYGAHIAFPPRVFIRRVALYESFSIGAKIREIPFTRGLNLIVGDDAEGQEGNLGGHSAGKTTLCRLIRHCLGEENFATAEEQDAIRENFPHGYVGCEVVINGVPWAVLIPFNRTSKSFPLAAREETLESLFDLEKKDNDYQDYLLELENIIPSSDGLHWKHLLAWLTRDQECIQGNYWDWRSGESQSGTSLPRSYSHRAFLFRTILGLKPDGEDALLESLKQIQGSIITMENKKADAEQAPKDQLRNSLRILHANLDFSLPEPKPGVDLPSARMELFFAKLAEDIAGTEEDHASAQEQVSLSTMRMAHHLVEARKHEAILTHKNKSLESMAVHATGSCEESLVAILKVIEDNPTCPANKLAADCEEVQKLRKAYELMVENEKRGKIVSFSDSKLQKEHDRLIETIKNIQKKHHDEISNYQHLYNELPKLKRDRDIARNAAIALYKKQELLKDHWSALQQAWVILCHNAENAATVEASSELKRLQQENEDTLFELSQLQMSIEDRAKNLSGIFSELVHEVTKGACSGDILIKNGRTEFRVRLGNNILNNGAMKALKVILGDIASMLSACDGSSRHPGFLVHDSPRNMDMNDWLYANILTCAAEKTEKMGGTEEAPFQYIVTTTSPPPSELEPLVREHLASAPVGRLLFKNRLERRQLTF